MSGTVPNGWQPYMLYDIALYTNGRPTKPSERQPTGVPVIKIAELNSGISSRTDRVPAEVVQDKHWVEEGDLLFAWSGSVGIHRYTGPRAALNQHIFKVEAKHVVDQRFLRYLLESQLAIFDGYVADKRTTMGHVTVRDLRQTCVFVPPQEEQIAIASVLGSLDDKIELNRRMNRTLEQMAAAIFKAWFVDFEPVRAKASGATSFPGMPQPVFDALPATFVDSVLGMIPEGWEVKGLDEIAEYLNGLALQRYPVDDGPSLPRLKIAQLRKGDTEGAELSNSKMAEKYIVRDGDVIFSWSGSLLVKLWTGGEAALNQHLFKVTSEEYPKWLYYLWTAHHLEDFQRTASSKATTMGHIKRHHLSDAKVVVPPVEQGGILDSMTAVIQPLLDLAINNGLESRTLAETRNALLPKLLSGAVRVVSTSGSEVFA